MRWNKIQQKVKNVAGKTPDSDHCVRNAVQRVTASGKKGVAKTNYKNCGRSKALTPEEAKKVLHYSILMRVHTYKNVSLIKLVVASRHARSLV